MGAYTCQYGVVHKMCRCPEPHTIQCDKVKEHSNFQTTSYPTTVEDLKLILHLIETDRIEWAKTILNSMIIARESKTL